MNLSNVHPHNKERKKKLKKKLETLDIGGYSRPFNDDINYPAMNSNALISIFHVSSHDMALEDAHTKMTGIMNT